MNVSDSNLESHLQTALQEADDTDARYHIRQALQLRVVEQTGADESV